MAVRGFLGAEAAGDRRFPAVRLLARRGGTDRAGLDQDALRVRGTAGTRRGRSSRGRDRGTARCAARTDESARVVQRPQHRRVARALRSTGGGTSRGNAVRRAETNDRSAIGSQAPSRMRSPMSGRACAGIRTMGDHLRVTWRVDDDAHQWPMPPFVIQPLVENALKHGLGSRIDGGHVRISVTQQGSGLRVRVEDDGAGFPTRWRDGQGLGNLRQRLQTMYGSRATMTVENLRPGARSRSSSQGSTAERCASSSSTTSPRRYRDWRGWSKRSTAHRDRRRSRQRIGCAGTRPPARARRDPARHRDA